MQYKTSFEYFIIYLPQITKDYIELEGGIKLWLDTTFNPAEHRIPKARVVATPKYYDTPVEIGDYIYFHHNIVKNEKFKLDDHHFAVPANPNDPLAYAYEKDGEINMLYDYMFVAPEEKDDSEHGNLLIKKKRGVGDTIQVGRVRHANATSLAKFGGNVASKIHFRKGRNAKFNVNGELLFRVKGVDVNFVYNE